MAASSMPLPVPPRTPTPPPDNPSINSVGINYSSSHYDEIDERGLFNGGDLHPGDSVAANVTFIPPSPNGSTTSLHSPSKSASSHSPYLDVDTDIPAAASEGRRNPFGFQSVQYAPAGASINKPNIGQRRGHKYKHSSVSHQIFLEPAPKAPLRLPASLPIPTAREGWKNMSREQTLRLMWCVCHLSVAGMVQWSAHGSLAVTALSHLIFYDAIGACLSAGVDVLSNFEVWNRSSVRHPFGLERAEVLVGFAMSIGLVFMGFDLISHNTAHMLEDVGNHEPHHAHEHERVSAAGIDFIALVAVASTVVSALMLRNHERIAKSMRFATISFLPSILSNPSHLLTLSCSGALLILPLLSVEMYTTFDQLLSLAMAALMCLLGFQLVKTLGAMLLMSYSGPGVPDIVKTIAADPLVRSVEEAKFWQVHYGLCMASLKLVVRESSEVEASRLRERITTLIKNRLGGGYGQNSSGQSWEITTQLILAED